MIKDKMLKYGLPALLAVLLFSCVSMGDESREHRLVVLHTNDTHGHPVSFFDYPMPGVGGLPVRSTFVKSEREKSENLLVLDAGDLNTGRPESNFYKAEPDLIGMNHIGYDAMVLGNHEFDNSLDVLKEQMELADFPLLSANIRRKDGSELCKPYIIKKFKGFKVAILGLTTEETLSIGNPEIIKDLVIEDEVVVARRLVPELRKKADLVIALVHLGIYDDNHRGSKRLAYNVDGIDLIIDGHSHTNLEEPLKVRNSYIVQAWHWGLTVGRAEITIKNRKIVGFGWKQIPMNLKNVKRLADGSKEITIKGKEIGEDKELVEKLKSYVDGVKVMLAEKIGEAKEPFLNDNVRKRETALGSMVADSMLWYAAHQEPDFAIQNGGGIRAALPSGEISKQTVYEILPFDNSVVVLSLKGEQVEELFNYIAAIPRGKGAFPQVSKGISFKLDRDTGRCENVLINGRPIDKERVYKIVTNSYLAAGGDGYKIFRKALDKNDTSRFQRDVFIDYIKELKRALVPETYHRIKVIDSRSSSLGVNKKARWVA